MEAQPNNFSYEKLSVSYDVVRPVVALVAMPKSLLAPERRNNPSKPNRPRRRQSEQPGLLSYAKNAIKIPFSMQSSAQFLAPTMLCRYENPPAPYPNNPNNPNNFSYEKGSVSYDVVRAVFVHGKFPVAHPKSLITSNWQTHFRIWSSYGTGRTGRRFSYKTHLSSYKESATGPHFPFRLCHENNPPQPSPVSPEGRTQTPQPSTTPRYCPASPAVDNRAFQYENTLVTLADMRKDASTYTMIRRKVWLMTT